MRSLRSSNRNNSEATEELIDDEDDRASIVGEKESDSVEAENFAVRVKWRSF